MALQGSVLLAGLGRAIGGQGHSNVGTFLTSSQQSSGTGGELMSSVANVFDGVPGDKRAAVGKTVFFPSNSFFHKFNLLNRIRDDEGISGSWERRAVRLSKKAGDPASISNSARDNLVSAEASMVAAFYANDSMAPVHLQQAIFQLEKTIESNDPLKREALERKAEACHALGVSLLKPGAQVAPHETNLKSTEIQRRKDYYSQDAKNNFASSVEAALEAIKLVESELAIEAEPYFAGELLEKKHSLHLIAAKSAMKAGLFEAGAEQFYLAALACQAADESYDRMSGAHDALFELKKSMLAGEHYKIFLELERAANELSKKDETSHGAGFCFAKMADMTAQISSFGAENESDLSNQYRQRAGVEFARFGLMYTDSNCLIKSSEQHELAGAAQLADANKMEKGHGRQNIIRKGIEYLHMALESRKMAIKFLDSDRREQDGDAQQQKADGISKTILKTERDLLLEQADGQGAS